MRKLCAAAMAAALVLPATGLSAVAQEDKISISGLVWFDHNGDRASAGEPVLAGETIVRLSRDGSDEVLGEYATDDKGVYAINDLAPGKYRVSITDGRYEHTTARSVVTEGGTVDFGLKGYSIVGLSFYDRNKDGIRQAGEELLSPGTLNGKPIAVSRENGQFSVDDLPAGKYEFVAADYSGRKLALAEPKGNDPIDWATGRLGFSLSEFEGPSLLSVLYVDPSADVALEASLAKDTYLVGEQIDLKLKLTNKGDVPVTPSFLLAEFDEKLVSVSDNVVEHGNKDFDLKHKLLPGKSADVELKFVPRGTDFTAVWPFVVYNFGGFEDVDRKNNSVKIPVKVVEKVTETTTTTAPATTAPTTTTTEQAVAQAAAKSGLASTGASPLGFLALGTLLLTAGAAAFVAARRRRS
ncbi:SdrD B-like domain-containing protein [Lentzea sp. CA-135723]|uniref:SdrD B-like domain-containing protein n=1 Tax=Lentzea sp. CA-135723 TaxID=3239950 RepID=UPI003D93A8F0